MNCPFCAASIPQGSELCPHCMSDLRGASPRGDRGTATDSGANAQYVPPKHGYVPPTQPGGNTTGVPYTPPGIAQQAFVPAVQVVPPAGYAVPPGFAGGDVTVASPYAPAPAPVAVPAPMAAPMAAVAPAPVAAPVYAAPAPGGAPAGYVPVPRETAQAGTAGRRRTALDADVANPSPEVATRGRTRLDREVGGQPGAAVTPQRRVVGWMISFDVNEAGQEYVLREGRNSLGRARDADVSIFYDDLVSATHATIVCRQGEFKLRDEMTNNGTFVNGVDIGPGATAPLKNGDILRVGRCTFKLFLLDPAEVAALWPHVGAAR